VSAFFFRQTEVGEDLADESGTNVEAHFGYLIGDFIHVEVRFESITDYKDFDLFGAFLRLLWTCSFW